MVTTLDPQQTTTPPTTSSDLPPPPPPGTPHGQSSPPWHVLINVAAWGFLSGITMFLTGLLYFMSSPSILVRIILVLGTLTGFLPYVLAGATALTLWYRADGRWAGGGIVAVLMATGYGLLGRLAPPYMLFPGPFPLDVFLIPAIVSMSAALWLMGLVLAALFARLSRRRVLLGLATSIGGAALLTSVVLLNTLGSSVTILMSGVLFAALPLTAMAPLLTAPATERRLSPGWLAAYFATLVLTTMAPWLMMLAPLALLPFTPSR